MSNQPQKKSLAPIVRCVHTVHTVHTCGQHNEDAAQFFFLSLPILGGCGLLNTIVFFLRTVIAWFQRTVPRSKQAAKKLERRKSLKAHNKKLKKIQSTSNQEQLSARRKREEQHRKRQEFLASAKAGKPSPQMRRKAAMARPKKNLPASYGNVGEYLDEARAQASPKTARKHPFINTSNQTSRV